MILLLAQNTPELLIWVRELGSLAILAVAIFFFGKFGLKRIDRMLDQNQDAIDTFKETIGTFQAFEKEERETHDKLDRNDKVIVELLKEIRQGLQS